MWAAGPFVMGGVLSSSAQSRPHLGVPSLLTQPRPSDERLYFHAAIYRRKKNCLRRKWSSFMDIPNWPGGYLILWPWVKRWHDAQRGRSHTPDFKIGIEIRVKTEWFFPRNDFEWIACCKGVVVLSPDCSCPALLQIPNLLLRIVCPQASYVISCKRRAVVVPA